MQPSKLSFDESLLILDKKKSSTHVRMRFFHRIIASVFEEFNYEFFFYKKNELITSDCTELKLYLGGNETVPAEFRESNVVHIRCMSARLLGGFVSFSFLSFCFSL